MCVNQLIIELINGIAKKLKEVSNERESLANTMQQNQEWILCIHISKIGMWTTIKQRDQTGKMIDIIF